MKTYKVFIGCPCYKWPLDPHTQASIQACMDHPHLDCEFNAIVGDAHIERARATVLAHYLKYTKPWDFMLTVDWDIEFRPQDLYNACARDIECLGGPYPFKSDEAGKGGNPVFRIKREGQRTEDYLLEAQYLGAGYTLCKDSLIQELIETYDDELGFNLNPDLMDTQDRTVALWNPIIIDRPDWGENQRELLSEDYSFCQRVHDIGKTCWLDLRVYLRHWDKDKCYTLPVEEVA